MIFIRFLLTLILSLGIAAILWTQTGPFAWVGGFQVAVLGSYSIMLTLILTVLIILAPLALIGILVRRSRGNSDPGRPGRKVPAGAFWCGGLLASAMVLAFGLAPLALPSRPFLPEDPQGIMASATLIPCQSSLPLTTRGADVDLVNQVAFGMRNAPPTIYAPIHKPGSAEVTGMVSGVENEWRNASIRSTPFPNAANEAALAKAGDAVLTLKPVPFFVRHQLAEKNLTVPLFLPTFEWGRHPLTANLPLIVGGAVALVSLLIGLVRSRRETKPNADR